MFFKILMSNLLGLMTGDSQRLPPEHFPHLIPCSSSSALVIFLLCLFQTEKTKGKQMLVNITNRAGKYELNVTNL